MQRIFLFLLLLIANDGLLFAQENSQLLSSPDGQISVEVMIADQIDFSIRFKGSELLKKGRIAMDLQAGRLGRNAQLIGVESNKVDESVFPPVPLKNAEISNKYNSLLMRFEGDFALEFRAFNNGVAYRFITDKNKMLTVVNEQADFEFGEDYTAFLSKTEEEFSNYEHAYQAMPLDSVTYDNLAVLPAYIGHNKAKVLIAEADVYDYPTMFVRGGENKQLGAWFPRYPEATETVEGNWWSDRRLAITKTADYIAKTEGSRSYPWRIFTIADEDARLAESDLVYLLSRPSEYSDFSWIKPGQTSWEWWHASNIIGVDFKSGYNTETYKYYIDFAAKYGLEYVLLDEGWSFSVTDISKPNPEIDLQHLAEYAGERDVKLILWASWLAVENMPTFFEQVKEIGAAGVKIDFMDRSDQWMVNYYERCAKRAFENELLVDFHGSFSPKGMRRAYPNIISYEGLTGMEQNKAGGHDLPNNRVILPFTRNVVGPMDYTPGAMNSVHPKFWHANWTNPMSIGTRAHQMALFVVFESGLQMLADNPSDYYKEDECTRYITDVPTVWDETRILAGEIGEYIVTAKRKGKDWYIAGITNDKSREVLIDFSFLDNKAGYELTLFRDGVNADKYALDYKKITSGVNAGDKMIIKMIFNGGFSGVIKQL